MSLHKLAVLTSGGDASGMNGAIRAVVRTAIYNGIEIYGIRHGYAGLLEREFSSLSIREVGDIIQRGGTMLQTSRSEHFMTAAGQQKAQQILTEAGIDLLIVIGGNGTLAGGWALHNLGFPVIGIPATIDNDVPLTTSIGFDTAVNIVLESINRIRDTATSHGRVFVLEVMGRECGEIALAAGLAGGAESILIPEIRTDIAEVIEKIRQSFAGGKRHSIVVVAEGAYSALTLQAEIEAQTGQETRVTILGHIQRGGTPTAADRILASAMGKHAVDYAIEGQSGVMTAGSGVEIHPVELGLVLKSKRESNLEALRMARILSI